jgi:hypothetical protein
LPLLDWQRCRTAGAVAAHCSAPTMAV